jgi:hypothetical protein
MELRFGGMLALSNTMVYWGLGQSSTQFQGSNATWVANAMPEYKQQLFTVNMPPTGSATFTLGYHDTAHEKGPSSFPYGFHILII